AKAVIEIPVAVGKDAGNNLSNQASAQYQGAGAPVSSNAYVAQVAAPTTGRPSAPPQTQPQQPPASQPQVQPQQPSANQPQSQPQTQPQAPPKAPANNPPASQPKSPQTNPPASQPKNPTPAPTKKPASS